MSGNGTDLEVGPRSGAGFPDQSMTQRRFLGTHPANEAITSELPVIRIQPRGEAEASFEIVDGIPATNIYVVVLAIQMVNAH